MALMNHHLIEIGKRLRERRKCLGYKRAEMAEHVGISPSYYNQLEVGTSQMSVETLISLSQAMEISMDYILLGVDKQSRSDKRIIELLYNCTPREMTFIEEIIKSYLTMKNDKHTKG